MTNFKLLALFVTLIVLLILAGVSLSGLFSEKGLFKRTENASNRYNEAKAREVLETVLLADGQYEKNTNPKYNQDDFLDELIKSEIPGSNIKGDVAIIGEYAYELDRSVPKIGRYLGKASDLVFPKVEATVKLSDDKKDATITITASEEKQGINKIEIWLLGEKIDEFPYDNIKKEITLPYTATQNGEYTIKAYGKLWDKTTVKVTGIVASVKFEPNGKEVWQKSHSTVVTIQETADKIVRAKYHWTNTVTTPEDNEFPENQTFKSGDTITKNGVTGTYYLWTMVETESGEKIKWRSKGFYFDNEGPIVKLTTMPITADSFSILATATDSYSAISMYEFYIDGVLINTQEIEKCTVEEMKTGVHNVTVTVYDSLGNPTTTRCLGETKEYYWAKYNSTDDLYGYTSEIVEEKRNDGPFAQIRVIWRRIKRESYLFQCQHRNF